MNDINDDDEIEDDSNLAQPTNTNEADSTVIDSNQGNSSIEVDTRAGSDRNIDNRAGSNRN